MAHHSGSGLVRPGKRPPDRTPVDGAKLLTIVPTTHILSLAFWQVKESYSFFFALHLVIFQIFDT